MEKITFYSDWDSEQKRAIVSVAEPWPAQIAVDEEVVLLCPQATRKFEGRIRFDVSNGWAEYRLREASVHGPLIGYYYLVESSFTSYKRKVA